MGSACDLHCQEPGHTSPQDRPRFLRLLLSFEIQRGGTCGGSRRVVPSTPLPVLLTEMVLASQVPPAAIGPSPWGFAKRFRSCLPPPSVMGGSCSWGLGDPPHSTYPQGTRVGASTRVSLTRVKGSWRPTAPRGQGGQGGAQCRQVTLRETSMYLL